MNHRHCQALLCLSLAASCAHAQLPGQAVPGAKSGKPGATVVVGLGAEGTDNAYKSTGTWSGCSDKVKHPNSPEPDCIPIEDETKEYVDLDLGYHREGEALVADILYKGEFAHYEHDTTDDGNVIQGHSMVAWRTLGKRLTIDASHDRSEQMQDSRSPDIRNNRQLRDIIAVGPTLRARLSPVDDLVFSGHWYGVSYDASDRDPVVAPDCDIGTAGCLPPCPPGTPQGTLGCLPQPNNGQNSDNERLEGGASWQHRRHKTDVFGLTYQYTDTEFDESSEQFEYHRVFGTYQAELRNSGYSISLGANRSERDSGDSSDGFLAQAAWHLENAGHRLRLTAINQLTDSGVGLGTNPFATGGEFQPRDDNFDVIDVVERTTVDLGYGYDRLCERCVIDVGLVYDEQDFDTAPRDQKRTGVRGSFGYRITSTLRASLHGDYSEIEYPEDILGSRTDERAIYGLLVSWQLSRSLNMRFWLNHDGRDSDLEAQSYDENYGGASIRYDIR